AVDRALAAVRALAQRRTDIDIRFARQIGDPAGELVDAKRRDEPLAHPALRREIAHVKELVALRVARQHPQVGEEIRVGLLLAPGHSHTSGVNTARYSNSPLSRGPCVGCRAAHAEHCSRVSSPRRIAATRWAGVICHSARSRASRAFKSSRIWSIRRLWLMVTLSVWAGGPRPGRGADRLP